MKKEVILAIAIGFALGLVITFGIWTANKSLASLDTNTPTPTPTLITISGTPQPTAVQPTATQVTSNSLLTITAPEDELLTNKNSVTVTGKATAGASVTIAYENNKQQIVVADASGNFTANVDLIAGYNIISVTAFDANGNESNQTITVTYSTAAIWNLQP